MHRHRVESAVLTDARPVFMDDDARHLGTVLRIRPGEGVELFDGVGGTRRYTVAAVEKRHIALDAVAAAVVHPRPTCAVTLFACVSKGGRMEWTIEKAVELGAARIVPVLSARTVVRLDRHERAAKRERWLRVAEEAGRQCGAVWLPQVDEPIDFAAALPLLVGCPPVFVAALTPDARPFGRVLLDQTRPPATAGWFSGPEGDFTDEELQALLAAGAVPVSLGSLVLRAETAAIYGLCVLGCMADAR